jgi:hypothetical protein
MIAAGYAIAMWFEKGKVFGDAQLSQSIRPSPCVTPGSAFLLPGSFLDSRTCRNSWFGFIYGICKTDFWLFLTNQYHTETCCALLLGLLAVTGE